MRIALKLIRDNVWYNRSSTLTFRKYRLELISLMHAAKYCTCTLLECASGLHVHF